jgi:tetratricopeptide (TPR) repeat protein
MNLDLDPSLHSVSNLCRLEDVLDYMNDPFNIAMVTFHVSRSKPLDVVDIIRLDRARRPGSRENEIINELLRNRGKIDQSLNDLIEDLTLIGKKDPVINEKTSFESVPTAIITAELRVRRGRDYEAKSIYQSLLKNRARLDPAYWIFCIVGLIKCSKVIDGQDEALALANRFLESVTDPASRSMINKNKADILQDMGKYKEAEQLYNSIIRTLRGVDMPHLKMMVLNNFGVLHFRQGKEDEAVECWKKARTIAMKNDLPWMEAISSVNLSDPYARKGKTERSRQLLRSARRCLERIKDQEGLSEYNFNMALVCIEEGNRDLALHYFKQCEDFPLQYREKRMERREVINTRFMEKGWMKPFDDKL